MNSHHLERWRVNVLKDPVQIQVMLRNLSLEGCVNPSWGHHQSLVQVLRNPDLTQPLLDNFDVQIKYSVNIWLFKLGSQSHTCVRFSMQIKSNIVLTMQSLDSLPCGPYLIMPYTILLKVLC